MSRDTRTEKEALGMCEELLPALVWKALCLADIGRRYHTAKEKLLDCNLIVLMERMRDTSYAQGPIRMFGN